MGGSGSYSSGAGSTNTGSTPTDCASFSVEVVLASVNLDLLTDFSVGSICDVTLLQNPTRIAVTDPRSGEALGAITSYWNNLLSCIEQGTRFEAELLSVISPVKVRIRAAI